LLASLVAGLTYFFVMDDPIGGLWLMLWKGAGVALLAAYAALRRPAGEGGLIVMALAFAAAGDMALEISFLTGGGLFAIGHLCAIALYLRERRSSMSSSQTLAAAGLLVLTPAIAAAMTYGLPNWGLATGYTALVGTMAAAAWSSSFPRYRVGLGAVLFATSDLLILAREGNLLDGDITSWLVWPLYFGGQFLIATGVVQTLRARAKNFHGD
jgi:uncharacterized membrane protein YhhN